MKSITFIAATATTTIYMLGNRMYVCVYLHIIPLRESKKAINSLVAKIKNTTKKLQTL